MLFLLVLPPTAVKNGCLQCSAEHALSFATVKLYCSPALSSSSEEEQKQPRKDTDGLKHVSQLHTSLSSQPCSESSEGSQVYEEAHSILLQVFAKKKKKKIDIGCKDRAFNPKRIACLLHSSDQHYVKPQAPKKNLTFSLEATVKGKKCKYEFQTF